MKVASANRSALLQAVFPDLADELADLLRQDGEVILADQVASLEIVDRCRCHDDFCAMFYTSPPPAGEYGPGHRNVALVPRAGDLILDVVNDRIMAVEVLYRSDVRATLHELLP
jgi:hypothetical protein